MSIRPVNMEFQYGTTFLSQSPEAYERLIMDAMRGDATLFTRDDEVEAQWELIDPILQAWAETTSRWLSTKAGTRRPRRGNGTILLAGSDAWRADLNGSGARRRRARRPSCALRKLVVDSTPRSEGFVPARTLNHVCVVEREWGGEVANRLRGVGRSRGAHRSCARSSRNRQDIDAVRERGLQGARTRQVRAAARERRAHVGEPARRRAALE
jgi:hypothetical protein